jgi:hypothetical protein
MPQVPYFSDEFVGRTVSFDKPQHSAWVLKRKLSENSDVQNEKHFQTVPSEARAVFVARKLGHRKSQQEEAEEEAIIKIRMQYDTRPCANGMLI